MRVIAGDLKGRLLKAVPGKKTRPTTDKIKEALFQKIGPFFNGGYCLDLFAGSGALGIEAISRGINKTIFVDNHSLAIQTIKHNLTTLDVTRQAECFRTDANRAIKAVAKRNLQFNLILLDPPYSQMDFAKLLTKIIDAGILHKNGLIVCEYGTSGDIPPSIASLELFEKDNYGKTTSIALYRKEKDNE